MADFDFKKLMPILQISLDEVDSLQKIEGDPIHKQSYLNGVLMGLIISSAFYLSDEEKAKEVFNSLLTYMKPSSTLKEEVVEIMESFI
jgi:hypothetical protein